MNIYVTSRHDLFVCHILLLSLHLFSVLINYLSTQEDMLLFSPFNISPSHIFEHQTPDVQTIKTKSGSKIKHLRFCLYICVWHTILFSSDLMVSL